MRKEVLCRSKVLNDGSSVVFYFDPRQDRYFVSHSLEEKSRVFFRNEEHEAKKYLHSLEIEAQKSENYKL